MQIAGIQTLSTLDYKDKLSGVIFTLGCNFRCKFCHNPQFVTDKDTSELEKHLIPSKRVLNFLDTRRNFLDGVVISGGEPTLQKDLEKFIIKIRSIKKDNHKNFLIKLDTNGTNPQVLQQLLKKELLDFVSLDIKASEKNYQKITNSPDRFAQIIFSRDLLLKSKITHEFRTTVVPTFHDEAEMHRIAKFAKGAQLFTIQNFRNTKVLDPALSKYTGFTKKN